MITVTQQPATASGNVPLTAQYPPLRCTLEATFYPQEKKLGIWIGGGDDWKEDFEPCQTIEKAIAYLTNEMKSFMEIAEKAL